MRHFRMKVNVEIKIEGVKGISSEVEYIKINKYRRNGRVDIINQ